MGIWRCLPCHQSVAAGLLSECMPGFTCTQCCATLARYHQSACIMFCLLIQRGCWLGGACPVSAQHLQITQQHTQKFAHAFKDAAVLCEPLPLLYQDRFACGFQDGLVRHTRCLAVPSNPTFAAHAAAAAAPSSRLCACHEWHYLGKTSGHVQVIAGMELTGPSLNPAVTFSWAVYQRRQYLSEHFVVFWLAPIAGGGRHLSASSSLHFSSTTTCTAVRPLDAL